MAQAPRNGAIPDYVEVLAGQDGTATRALKTDANGELQVDVLTQPAPPTCRALRPTVHRWWATRYVLPARTERPTPKTC